MMPAPPLIIRLSYLSFEKVCRVPRFDGNRDRRWIRRAPLMLTGGIRRAHEVFFHHAGVCGSGAFPGVTVNDLPVQLPTGTRTPLWDTIGRRSKDKFYTTLSRRNASISSAL